MIFLDVSLTVREIENLKILSILQVYCFFWFDDFVLMKHDREDSSFQGEICKCEFHL